MTGRNLYSSVATYAPVLASVAEAFLKEAFNGLLAPLLSQRDVSLTLGWSQGGSQYIVSDPFVTETWDSLAHASSISGAVIQAWKEGNREAGKNPVIACATVHNSLYPDLASTLEFSASQAIYGESIHPVIQQRLVALALSVFEMTDSVVGYITMDYVAASVYGSMSPYERAIGQSYPQASREFRSKVRGYYWGNLIHRLHVDLLGGQNALLAIPAYLVKPIGNGGYYIQLTSDINDINRKKLRQLKQFFAPLLPEEIPQSSDYYQSLPDLLI